MPIKSYFTYSHLLCNLTVLRGSTSDLDLCQAIIVYEIFINPRDCIPVFVVTSSTIMRTKTPLLTTVLQPTCCNVSAAALYRGFNFAATEMTEMIFYLWGAASN